MSLTSVLWAPEIEIKKKNGTGALSNRAHGLFYPRYHCTKNWIYTNLLGANIVQKSANEEEVKFKDGKYCKFVGKCAIYNLLICRLFNLSLHFFALYLL